MFDLKKYIFNFFFGLFLLNNSICDTPKPFQISFQDPATPVMEGIISLYDYLFYFLIFIIVFVCWFIARICVLFAETDSKRVQIITQNVKLEAGWTITPAFILAAVAGNSITHLYSAEDIGQPQLDVTIIGCQWYWIYEFMVFNKKVSIESHMIDTNDLKLGSLRLLEVDRPLVLPINTNIRLLVSSYDVIHSWAVPSFGVKIDAVPGRINEGLVYLKRTGIFRGQCSEICGKGHAEMPIVVVGIKKDDYYFYLHQLNTKILLDDMPNYKKHCEAKINEYFSLRAKELLKDMPNYKKHMKERGWSK
jgi:cytochrome c oxidase subunit II